MLRRPKTLDAGKHYVIEGECWVWAGKLNSQGYGLSGAGFWQLHTLAHRASYMLAGHALQKGVHLHHRCENKACVNPAHLEPTLGCLHLAHHRQEESPLTWNDVREIRRRAHGDVFPIELMEEFGISRQSIGQIILNQSWVDPGYEPPTLERVCARPDCAAPFTPVRANNRFCSKTCRDKHNNRVAWRRKSGVSMDVPFRVYNRKAA